MRSVSRPRNQARSLGDALHVLCDERDLLGESVVAFTVEAADLPSLGPAVVQVPAAKLFFEVVVKDDRDGLASWGRSGSPPP
jgi:hypothetical protein